MELNNVEMALVESATNQGKDDVKRELLDLQLATLGSGLAEVSLY